MIRIPEKLALEIESLADKAFEKAKKQFPLNNELWDSLESLKEEILNDLSVIGGNMEMVLQDPELRNALKEHCVKLGTIRRIQNYVDPNFVPPTIV